MISKIFSKVAKVGVIAVVLLPALAFAQISPVDPVQDTNLVTLVNRVVGYAIGILILVALVYIIIAAYRFLVDDDKAKAKSYLLYAIVAIGVALLSKVIIVAIVKLFGGQTPGGF